MGSGWTGKKTSPTTILFFASNPISPGNSTMLTISTDQSTPDLVWNAFDLNNNQLGTGEIGAPVISRNPPPNTNQTQNTNKPPPPTINPGILGTSSFRIIPSTPAPGFDVRVVGQSFGSSAPLDLYLGSQKIDSFAAGSDGNFVITTTVPQSQQPGTANFVLKDQANNQKMFTTSIEPSPPPRKVNQSAVPLTVNVDPILHPGDTGSISGTANPGSTVAISIEDSTGTSITTFTATADKTGKYAVSQIIPNDRPFGKYTVVVSDGQDQVSKDYTVTTTHQISISTAQQKYDPGQVVTINGTAISNQPVSITITDPTNIQIYAKDVNVTSGGKISLSYQIDPAAIIGTYVITATQGSDSIPLYIGVGADPVTRLTATLDKLNYQLTDKPVLSISAPPTSTLNLVIVDPSDQEKFSDIILIGPSGLATYSFNLTSYTPGIYSAVLTRGDSKVHDDFSVGLQTGCGQISLRTVKDTYSPGDGLLIFGNANPDCIIQLALSNPNGQQVKSEQTFVDKKGIFSAFDFRIPDDGVSGTWKLDATSGIDHKSLDVNVQSQSLMTVQLDKSPPIYSTGSLVRISGTGAGHQVGVVIRILASNSTLDTLDIQSTNSGDYSTEWLVPTSISTGSYIVQVKSIVGTVTTPITIQ
ncbi:MAG: hypothetical protein KGH99_06675 [Thaumarchaeota archaeon]|nr:hypothetical protein [Nitrososphaerota archaeon]